MPLQNLGGARSYVPKAIREKHTVDVSRHRFVKPLQRAEASTPAFITNIFGDGGGSGIFRGKQGLDSTGVKLENNVGGSKGGPHRFSQAQREAHLKKREREEKESQLARGKMEREKANRMRSIHKCVVRKRTAKGQPLLSARMKGLLSKVEKIVGDKNR